VFVSSYIKRLDPGKECYLKFNFADHLWSVDHEFWKVCSTLNCKMFLYNNETLILHTPLQLLVRLYRHSTNLNSFTAYLHEQQPIKYTCTVTKITVKYFASCSCVVRINLQENAPNLPEQCKFSGS
jgi:hypothetical protein